VAQKLPRYRRVSAVSFGQHYVSPSASLDLNTLLTAKLVAIALNISGICTGRGKPLGLRGAISIAPVHESKCEEWKGSCPLAIPHKIHLIKSSRKEGSCCNILRNSFLMPCQSEALPFLRFEISRKTFKHSDFQYQAKSKRKKKLLFSRKKNGVNLLCF
jgi:hypothetical protein